MGANRDIGPGTLSHGSLQRGSRVMDQYQPSYEPNESTLRHMARKEKEAEAEKNAPVNPTYIDDDFDHRLRTMSISYSMFLLPRDSYPLFIMHLNVIIQNLLICYAS